VGNLILAAILAVVIVLVLFAAYGFVVADTWERYGLDHGLTEGTWLWLDEQPIHYQDLGEPDSPCVVLVHGHYVEGSQTWQTAAEDLTKAGLRVVTIDLRGYGHSSREAASGYTVRDQAEVLATVLNELGVRGATVVAHDWGSAVALQMALDQPQFVDDLILIAPLLEQRQERVWRYALEVPYLRRAALWARYSGGPILSWERRHVYADTALVNRDDMQSIREVSHIVGTLSAFEAMALAPIDSDLPDALPDVDMPTLILLGESDPYLPSGAPAALEELPQADTIVLPETGHFLHIERAPFVMQQIMDAAYGN
jgi:pimeloyl-ACP methyl ester carboxylesterase